MFSLNNFAEYEVMFVVDSALEAEEVTNVVEKFKGLISSHGEIKNIDE